jgi:cytochrome bd-type quinol oxidase subunit 2
MADTYYYMWEFVTSVTIIILVAAYIIHDRLVLKYESLDKKEIPQRLNRLNSMMMSVLGILAFLGGGCWIYYIKTHQIFITEELMGIDTYVPAIIMGSIGLLLIVLGIKKHISAGDLQSN